ncbi:MULTISPECIES: hypothetical protein [Cupriavidus]
MTRDNACRAHGARTVLASDDDLDLHGMLVAIAGRPQPGFACGAALDGRALLEIGLAKQLAQAGGDSALALDDARGGLARHAAYPRALVELDGIEQPIDTLGPQGRMRALFALWSRNRMSFPLLSAVLADRGHDWREFRTALIAAPHGLRRPLTHNGAC